jgi:hypothetical protein
VDRPLTPTDARSALDTVERGQRRVIDEISVPSWYWWAIALCWIGLGFIADLGHGGLTAVALFAFGTIHAAVAPRVVSGRHGSPRLSVRAAVAGRDTPRLVIGGLLALAAVTIAASLAASADGANHPTTMASVLVAAIIVLGGPQLLAVVRRRSAAAAFGE